MQLLLGKFLLFITSIPCMTDHVFSSVNLQVLGRPLINAEREDVVSRNCMLIVSAEAKILLQSHFFLSSHSHPQEYQHSQIWIGHGVYCWY